MAESTFHQVDLKKACNGSQKEEEHPVSSASKADDKSSLITKNIIVND